MTRHRIDGRAAHARYDDDVLLQYIQRLAKLLKHTPSMRDTDEADGPCGAVYQRRFGSWQKSHIAAGLPPNAVGCPVGPRRGRGYTPFAVPFEDYASGTYRGIFFDPSSRRRKAWAAAIEVRGKRVRLGRFYTPADAARAYDAAAIEHVGAGARVNFPSETGMGA
jgi:hypothetical protein